jgi:hypothetical protein
VRMRDEIEAAFPTCFANHCIVETKEHPVLIKDANPGKCVIVSSASDAHFTVFNPNKKNITFIPIDKCIWDDSSGHKKCDFAITDVAIFAFVEIKDTLNRSSSNKKDAKEQLEETIRRFAAVSKLKTVVRKAVISWKYIPSKPAASTLMQSSAVHFWDTYGFELLEGNEISF